MQYCLSEITDLERAQELMGDLAAARGVRILIASVDGATLLSSGANDVCAQFSGGATGGRKPCRQGDEHLDRHLSEGREISGRCKHGLSWRAVPITVKGEHVANLFVSQFLLEKPSKTAFRRRGKELGLDEDAYLGAIRKVPVLSENEVRRIADHCTRLVQVLSEGALRSLDERQAQRALRESEERYRLLVESSPVAIVVYTAREILFANEAFLELMGVRSTEDLLGRSLRHVLAPDSAGALEKRQNQLAQGPPIGQCEGAVVRPDGGVLDVEISLSAVSLGGRPAYQAVISDVTERKRIEREKEATEVQLAQARKMEAIGTLAGGVAHDFNNILGAIMGYTELVKDGLPEGSEARANLEAALRAGRRAGDLIEQILAFTRQAETRRRPVMVRLVVKEALRLLRASIPTTIDIRQRIAPDPGAVLADPTQLEQVLINLCTNAYQAMEEEGGVLEVSLAPVKVDASFAQAHPRLREGDYLLLTVSDTGCGMDEATLERAFEPFFTTKEKGKGTGLGLATVRGIVSALEGDILVHSAPGKGSAFEVYLPRFEVTADSETPEKGFVPRGNGERVLLVDDEPAILHMGRQMLERLNYEVVTMNHSPEALAAFRKDPGQFDLVVTDQTMPKITGARLAVEMMRIRPDLPVVLTTGFSKAVSPERAELIGVRQFLPKPFTMRTLGEAVHLALSPESQTCALRR
jgi:PAS domain S-box-containing protein